MFVFASLVGWAAVTQLSGCTIIGGIIGATTSTKPKTVEGWQLEKLRKRDRVEVRLADGSVHIGYFRGLDLEPLDAYGARYLDWYQAFDDARGVPFINDLVTVTNHAGSVVNGQFQGFDEDVIYLGKLRGYGYNVVRTSDIAHLTFPGHEDCNVDLFCTILEADNVPLRTVIVLSDRWGRNIRYIDRDRIEQVKVKGQNYVVAGILVGIGIDMFMLATIEQSEEDWSFSHDRNRNSSSCPFVYSNDGSGYRLEGEMLGGAFFEAAQRSDWIDMKQLTEVDGAYHVRIANARDETDFINEVKLVVLDHPEDTRAFTARDGRFFVLEQLQAPITATDYGGSDVTSLLASPDSDFWMGDPIHLNPDKQSDLRDGVILDFARTPNSIKPVLALRLMNAPWISSVEQDLMALHGENLADWYELLNRSEEARDDLAEMVARDALLRVDVWNGNEWVKAGQVQGMSTMVWGDVAIPIDLSSVQAESLRIRLSSSAGFWLINSAQVGLEVEKNIRTVTLMPQLATGQHGADVLADVLNVDDYFYAMPSNDYWLDLAFPSWAKARGMQRSMFLNATGYYVPHLSPEGPGNIALLQEVMSESGGLGRFALKQLQVTLSDSLDY